jgi:hypothetical protein
VFEFFYRTIETTMVAPSEPRETRDAHPSWMQNLTQPASRASVGSA